VSTVEGSPDRRTTPTGTPRPWHACARRGCRADGRFALPRPPRAPRGAWRTAPVRAGTGNPRAQGAGGRTRRRGSSRAGAGIAGGACAPRRRDMCDNSYTAQPSALINHTQLPVPHARGQPAIAFSWSIPGYYRGVSGGGWRTIMGIRPLRASRGAAWLCLAPTTVRTNTPIRLRRTGRRASPQRAMNTAWATAPATPQPSLGEPAQGAGLRARAKSFATSPDARQREQPDRPRRRDGKIDA
jgi:hypothetical protein